MSIKANIGKIKHLITPELPTPSTTTKKEFLTKVVRWMEKQGAIWQKPKFSHKVKLCLQNCHQLDPEGEGLLIAIQRDNVELLKLMVEAYQIQQEPFFTKVFNHNSTLNPLECALLWEKYNCGRLLIDRLGDRLPELLNTTRETSVSIMIYREEIPRDIKLSLLASLQGEQAARLLPYAIAPNTELVKAMVTNFRDNLRFWENIHLEGQEMELFQKIKSEVQRKNLITLIPEVEEKQRNRQPRKPWL